MKNFIKYAIISIIIIAIAAPLAYSYFGIFINNYFSDTNNKVANQKSSSSVTPNQITTL